MPSSRLLSEPGHRHVQCQILQVQKARLAVQQLFDLVLITKF